VNEQDILNYFSHQHRELSEKMYAHHSNTLHHKLDAIMSQLDTLIAAVAQANATADAALSEEAVAIGLEKQAVVLIQTLATQLANAVNSGDMNQIANLSAELTAKSNELTGGTANLAAADAALNAGIAGATGSTGATGATGITGTPVGIDSDGFFANTGFSVADTDGAVDIKAVFAQRKVDPTWNVKRFFVPAILTDSNYTLTAQQKENISGNGQLAEVQSVQIGGNKQLGSKQLIQAFAMSPSATGNFVQGPQFADILAFPSTSVDSQGNVTFQQATAADMPAFVQNSLNYPSGPVPAAIGHDTPPVAS
jgi:hypothetical protein